MGMKIHIGLLVLAVATAGCGVAGAPGEGSVAVVVSNSKSFDPNARHGRVESYVVTIEGEGIAEPIEASFEGDATEGIIDGVPVGRDRTVSVVAVNPNGATIRAGESSGVSITEGLTPVEVQMQAVPIFTNIRDGAAIDNTRLVFRLFSDPQNPVVAEEISDGVSSGIADASLGVAEIQLDVATGTGKLSPLVMPPGDRRFVVRDLVTGRSSSVLVKLLDGSKRRGAPFFGAGADTAGASFRFGSVGEGM